VCPLYIPQSKAASLGDLNSFFAPPYDVLTFPLTYHRSSAIFQPVKSNVLSFREPGDNIDDLLTEGQDVIVQIYKEPIGAKGARLTCNITLPCRNLVFMPFTDHVGISRKIEDENIKEHLREKIEKLRPKGAGFIARTVAKYTADNELEADMEFLMALWDEIMSRSINAPVPSLVHQDLNLILRSIRDLFTDNVDRVIIDDKIQYDKLIEFMQIFASHLIGKVIHHDKPSPIFESYNIELDINRILDKKVWLPSGGHIIIETTEALTVIDVNTGRYTGKNKPAETVFKTNMEAVREISYQLRLRNIGGIIIVDFIDMENEEHKEKLFDSFQESMLQDQSRVNILRISEFGLVQMTRKRSCESLQDTMTEPCYYCSGRGRVKSRHTTCYDIFRKIRKNAADIKGASLTIKVNPKVADTLLKEHSDLIDDLENNFAKRIIVIPNQNMHIERYEIIWNE